MLNILIIASSALVALLLAWPRLANAPQWKATITPLASIIGSGFLVLGPILVLSYGRYAPLVMLGLCVVAYLFGASIRHNIAHIASGTQRTRFAERLEKLASVVLAFAYVISVAYYLNLFGAFGVSLTPFDDSLHARLLTTAIFFVILIVGWSKGFSALERLEQFSVGLKLAIIAGLLVGLGVYFWQTPRDAIPAVPVPTIGGRSAIALAAGLIVTVQGFETTRYLGATYNATTRILAMRLSQWLSTVIYLIYIGLLTYAFDPNSMTMSETAIIELMSLVAPVLPALLVAAALSAQFSAAVADTTGSGGLIDEITRGLVPPRLAYALIVTSGLALTWSANVFEIISFASRGFALYYAIQAAIAAITAQSPWRSLLYSAVALVAIFAASFGQAIE